MVITRDGVISLRVIKLINPIFVNRARGRVAVTRLGLRVTRSGWAVGDEGDLLPKATMGQVHSQETSNATTGAKGFFDYNLAEELIRSEKTALGTNTLLDRETWGLDTGGNWLSHTRSSNNLMETRTVDNMNRLNQMGGAGTTVVEGGINAPSRGVRRRDRQPLGWDEVPRARAERPSQIADVTVNSQPAELKADPATGGYRYRRPVPVTVGSNTVEAQWDRFFVRKWVDCFPNSNNLRP